MHILFLTTIHLTKRRNGGEVASQCFVNALRQLGHTVKVLGYLRKGDSLSSQKQDLIVVGERHIETRQSKRSLLNWYALSFIKGLPYSSAKYYSETYIQLIKQQLCTTQYDLLIIDHAQLGWLLEHIPKSYPIITIAHNIEEQIYQESGRNSTSIIARWVYQREARLTGSIEQRLARSTQQVWALTENDARYFANFTKNNSSKVFSIPSVSELPEADFPIKSFDIGLLGSWGWAANDETLRWFLRAVYPLLPSETSIHVAGKGADWIVGQYPNVHYEGVVPDAQAFLAQAKVVAIPTLRGGGIQIKTLDAIASGSSIVATPVAVRGISNLPSTVHVVEKPEDFAKLLISLTHSTETTQKKLAETFDWCRNRQMNFLNSIAAAISQIQDSIEESKALPHLHLGRK